MFVVGTDFYKPLLIFINNILLKEGTMSKDDFDIIRLTDNLEIVADEVKISLQDQLQILNRCGSTKNRLL